MENSDGQNGQQNFWNFMQSLPKDFMDMIRGNGPTHNQTPDQNSLYQVSYNSTPHNMCPTSCPNFFKEYCSECSSRSPSSASDCDDNRRSGNQYRLDNSQFQTEHHSSTQQIHSLAYPTDGTIVVVTVEQTLQAVRSAFKPFHDRINRAMDSPIFHSMKNLDDQETHVDEKYCSECSSRSSSSAFDCDDNTRSEKKRKKKSKARKLNPCLKPKKRKSSKKCVSSSIRGKHASTRKK